MCCSISSKCIKTETSYRRVCWTEGERKKLTLQCEQIINNNTYVHEITTEYVCVCVCVVFCIVAHFNLYSARARIFAKGHVLLNSWGDNPLESSRVAQKRARPSFAIRIAGQEKESSSHWNCTGEYGLTSFFFFFMIVMLPLAAECKTLISCQKVRFEFFFSHQHATITG